MSDLKVLPSVWIDKRQESMLKTIDGLKQIGTIQLPSNPGDDLNDLHAVISRVRGYQEWVRTSLVQAISLELEVKRLLANAEITLKDEIGKAFTTYAAVVEKAKSFEEKMLRLREYIPAIKEKEEWESILDSVRSFKEAVEMVYRDLNSASMSVHAQIQVIRNQVLTGQMKIQVDGFTAKGILQEGTLDSVEKAAARASNESQVTL